MGFGGNPIEVTKSEPATKGLELGNSKQRVSRRRSFGSAH